MVGVILMTHGGAGEAMLRAARSMVGPLEGVVAVELAASDSAEQVERRIAEALRAVGGEEVLFLVDLGGSTLANVACRVPAPCSGIQRRAVVSGVNLGMLFKLSTLDRREGLEEVARELAASGTKSIHVWSEG